MLNVIEPDIALEIILKHICQLNNFESIPISAALGRITAKDIISECDVPPFTRSTVDGFALNAADSYGASDALPAMLLYKGAIEMGESENHKIDRGECYAIPTGGKLPEGADSVVMLEYTEDIGDEYRYIQKSVAVLQNVTRKGEDISRGACVIKKGTLLTPSHIGICASLGITELPLIKQPVIGIISTGDELVDIEQEPVFSQIRDTNIHLLSAFVENCGCKSRKYPIVKDNKVELETMLLKATFECDVVLISGGSSAGEKDAVFSVLKKNGTVYFHGLAMKPGKPAMFAQINNKSIFGLPGHPAAAYFVCLRLVRPALYKITGKEYFDNTITAISESNIPADSGREELIPVSLSNRGNCITAEALFMKSGIISVLSNADGYIVIGRNTEGIGKGEIVEVHSL